MADLLEFKDVTKVYSRGLLSKSQTTALAHVSLKLDDAKSTIMTVAGESGSGKTTLAMLLSGIYRTLFWPNIIQGPGYQQAQRS